MKPKVAEMVASSAVEPSVFAELPAVHSLGDIIYASTWNQLHISGGTELLYVRRGSIELVIAGRKYLGTSGDVLLVPPGTQHLDDFPDQTVLEVFLVQFTWPCVVEFFDLVNNCELRKLPRETKFQIGRLLDSMRFDKGAGKLDHLVANSRLHLVLLLMYRGVRALKSPPDLGEDALDRTGCERSKLLVEGAKRYLEANYHRHIGLDDVAEDLQVSSFYLSRIFSRENDFSFVEYLNEIRMSRALELLAEGRMVINEIAAKTGFSSRHYFTKVFKRRFGVSPSRYRRDR